MLVWLENLVRDSDRGVVKKMGRGGLHVLFVRLLVKGGFVNLSVYLGSIPRSIRFLIYNFRLPRCIRLFLDHSLYLRILSLRRFQILQILLLQIARIIRCPHLLRSFQILLIFLVLRRQQLLVPPQVLRFILVSLLIMHSHQLLFGLNRDLLIRAHHARVKQLGPLFLV